MSSIICPSCRRKIRVPEHLAGRKVTCPKCEAVIVLPLELPELIEKMPAPQPDAVETEEPLPLSARLGIVALTLGLGSILILCLPVLGGYAAIGMSGLGLLMGLCGLHLSRADGGGVLRNSLAGGIGVWGTFGARAQHYPLAALGACFFALILALLPKLLH
jgi:hypothetical protein